MSRTAPFPDPLDLLGERFCRTKAQIPYPGPIVTYSPFPAWMPGAGPNACYGAKNVVAAASRASTVDVMSCVR